MKSQMAWSSAGMKCGRRLWARFKLSVDRIEAVDHDSIVSEIRGEGEAIRPVQLDAMRVWTFLLFAGTGTFVLPDVDRGAKTAVGENRQHGHGAARVIGYEQVLSITVETQMTRIGAFGKLLVDERQL